MRATSLCLAALVALASTTAPALADDVEAEPVRPKKTSMKPALIATAVTGALVAATVFSYGKFHGATEHQHNRDIPFSDPNWVEKQQQDIENLQTWRDIAVISLAFTVVSAGVTGYMWSARETIPSVNVSPMSGGVRVSYGASF